MHGRIGWALAVCGWILLVAAACNDISATNPYDPLTPTDQQAVATVSGTLALPEGFDNALLEGTLAELHDLAHAENLLRAPADQAGAFTFDRVPAGTYDFRVPLDGFRLAQPVLVTVAFGDTAALGTLTLAVDNRADQQGTLQGVARREGVAAGENGGIAVRFVGRPWSAVTEAEGNFEASLPAGLYDLSFESPGYGPKSVGDVRIEPGRVTVLADAFILEAQPGSIQGVVELSEFGDAERTRAIEVRLSRDGTELDHVSPDGDGAYVFRGLGAGTYTLTASREGYRPAQTVVSLSVGAASGAPPMLLDLLDATGTLSGVARLAFAAADANAGTLVEVLGRPWRMSTGPDGAFVFVLPPDRYTLRFSHAGYGFQDVPGLDVAVAQVTSLPPLVLAAQSGVIRGTAALPAGYGTPDRLARVHVLAENIAGASPDLNGTAGDDGFFELRDAVAGDWRVTVSLDGFESSQRRLHVAPGEVLDLGRVLLASSTPDQQTGVRGLVHLEGVDAADGHGGILVEAVDTPNATTTTSSGEFLLLLGAERRPITLRFQRDGYAVQTQAIGVLPVGQVQVMPNEVLLDARPGALRGSVSLARFGGVERLRTVDIALSRGDAPVDGSRPDDAGQYAFRELGAGSYSVVLHRTGYADARVDVELGPGQTHVAQPVVLEHLSDTDAAAPFSGRIRLAGREEHGGVTVSLTFADTGESFRQTVTDASGAFSLPAAGDERYVVSADYPGFVSLPELGAFHRAEPPLELFVDDLGRPLDHTLRSEPPVGSVSVELDLQPDWLPAAEQYVRLQLVGPGVGQTRERVFSNGEPEVIGPLPFGTFVVQAIRSGFASEPQTVTLTPASPRGSVRLAVSLVDLAAARLDWTGQVLTFAHFLYLSEHHVNLVGAGLARIAIAEGTNVSPLQLDLTGVDLSNAHLSGVTLDGVILSGANLFGADLTDASLRCADLRGANLFGANLPGAVFDGASLQRTNLSSANLYGASLRFEVGRPADAFPCEGPPRFDPDTRFNQADLSRAVFGLDAVQARDPAMLEERAVGLEGVSFAGAIMDSTTLIGADLTDADLALTRLRGTDLRGARLVSASLEGSVLLASDFTGADLSNVSALGAIFGDGTTLTGARFDGARLQNTLFVGISSYSGASFEAARLASASLAGEDLGCQSWDPDASACDPALDAVTRAAACVSFQGAQMQGANLLQANLGGADFTGAVLASAHLFEAELTCTRLTDTNLRAADLTRASVSGALFENTTLELANLSSVDFSGLTLSSVSLAGADLSQAVFDATIFRDADLRQTDMLAAAGWTGARFQGDTLCANGLPVSDPRNGTVLDVAHPENARLGTCHHAVYEGGLFINTQADADAARDLSGVTGGLTVNGLADLDLDFYALAFVGGDLTVNNHRLTRLGAMPALSRVGGDVNLQNCDSLLSIETIGSAERPFEIAGRFSLAVNRALASIEGLQYLRSIGGSLSVSRNDVLASLEGLRGLTFVGDSLSVSDNPVLTDVDGLAGLTAVGGGLRVSLHPLLTNVDGLQNVQTIGSDLTVHSNDVLQSLGLRSLRAIGGQLFLGPNPLLRDLDGLVALETVGRDLLVLETALADITGLGNLTHVGTELTFQRNTSLPGCAPWALLEAIGRANVGGSDFRDNAPDCLPYPACCSGPLPACPVPAFTLPPEGGDVAISTLGLPDLYQASCGGVGPEEVVALPLAVRAMVTAEMVAATFDTLVFTVACEALAPAEELACNDDLAAGNVLSRVTIGPLDPATYFILVDGFQGASGTGTLRVTVTPQ